MAEYIERESAMLLPELPKEYRHYQTDNLDDAYEHGWDDALCCLEHIPAADVAPVVRCKDCKYWQDNNDGYPHEECRWGHGETPEANDFCSYGEQKDGGSDAKEN